MTNVELAAYVEALPGLRAERMLDAAQVAVYPLHARFSPKTAARWWDGLARTVQQAAERTAGAAVTGARFTFNGAAVGFKALKHRLGLALGAGLRDE